MTTEIDQLNGIFECPAENIIGASGIIASKQSLCATDDDPWIIVSIPMGTRYISVEATSSSGLKDDDFKVYYSYASSPQFDEAHAFSFHLGGKSFFKKVLTFNKEVTFLRLDISDSQGSTKIEHLKVSFHETRESLSRELLGPCQGNGVIVCSHDLSRSGAPLLANNISKELKEHGHPVAALAATQGPDNIASMFIQSEIPLFDLDTFFIGNSIDFSYEDSVRETLAFLAESGFTAALLNTVLSGEKAHYFKARGIKTITLVHETAPTIKIHDFIQPARLTAAFSDYIVFPAETVKDGFLSLMKDVRGECLVHPQGVYNVPGPVDEKRSSKALSKLGIPSDGIVVLGSGTINLQKGFDLFVSCANQISQQEPDLDIRFLWAGAPESSSDGRVYFGLVMHQAESSSIKERFKVLGFLDQEQYRAVLGRADLFWNVSREDTFPSVVLEAMFKGIPVVAFSNTGGVDAMLADERGVLIDEFSISDFAQRSLDLLKNQELCQKIAMKAEAWVKKTLDFGQYVQWLRALCSEPERIPTEEVSALFPIDDSFKKRTARDDSFDIPRFGRLQRKFGFPRTPFSKEDRRITTILDTSLFSGDPEDAIVMDYCNAVVRGLGVGSLVRVPTHVYDDRLESLDSGIKIACGTDLIGTHMESNDRWAFPMDISKLGNLCMLGVGLQDPRPGAPFSQESVDLLKYLLDNRNLHSVRDSNTERRLREIGIENVVNTSSPSLWNLDPAHCDSIPRSKGRSVVTTVADYSFDEVNDPLMLQILKENYDSVYIWLQGKRDYDRYLARHIDPADFIFIDPSLHSFDEYLEDPDLDYVGTRLPAGIRALNKFHRSIIIAIDNRARNIAADTGLPVIEREVIASELDGRINSTFETIIDLPIENIARWKSQF